MEYVDRLRGLSEVYAIWISTFSVFMPFPVQDYLKYIQLEPTVPADLKADVLAIFSNLPEIYTFHNE